jgi:DNA polymerase III subunit delta'
MNMFGDDDLIYDEDLGSGADNDLWGDDPAPTSPPPPTQKLVPSQSNPLCLGHEKQESFFLDMFNKGKLPHAMIFSGPQGIGKSTMAFRLTRFLLKHGGDAQEESDSLFGGSGIKLDHSALDVDPHDPVFTRIASGGHQDFRYIERAFDTEKGKRDSGLKVETLRQIEPFLRMRASNGGWRVVLIDDADTMNRNAQNALLKILEEPPSKVMIILIAHRLGALIPTIRSRARVIPFTPLDSNVMADLLARQGHALSTQDIKRLNALSQGSAGQALRYAEEGGLTLLELILDHINDPTFPNWVKIFEFAQELSAAAQDKEYRLYTELMEWIFRQILFAKAKGENTPPDYIKSSKLEEIMRTSSLEKLIKICDDLKILFARTDFSNLDRRDAVRGGFHVIIQ